MSETEYIIGWDVGIKNLAYCILDFNNNKIIDWEIINVLDNNNDVHKKCQICLEKKKNRKIKKVNKSKYFFIINETKYYSCGVHLDKFRNNLLKEKREIIMNKASKEISKENRCCHTMKSGKNKGKNCKVKPKWFYQNKNLYFCTSHKNKYLKDIDKLSESHQIKSKSSKKIATETIMKKMIKRLNGLENIFSDKKIKYCVIENQPNLNSKMRSIADCLYTWFIIKRPELINLKYVSATTKLLKCDQEQLDSIKKSFTQRDRYLLTKNTGVSHCVQLLLKNDDQKWLEFLSNHSKKDDLCDAYLLADYYIFKKKLEKQ